jgi:transcriptional regulator with XRE-family HTH domain
VKSDPEIRRRLRQEFKRIGVSIEEVSIASGIAKGTLDNIMIGRVSSMKDVHLSALCRAYPDLPLLYILTGHLKENIDLRNDVKAAFEASARALNRLRGE